MRPGATSKIPSKLPARDSGGDTVNAIEVLGSTLANVAKPARVGESILEDCAAEGFDFDLPDGFPARLLKAKVKPSYPRE